MAIVRLLCLMAGCMVVVAGAEHGPLDDEHGTKNMDDAMPDGPGKKTFDNGATYEGGWKDGKRHGSGKYTFVNGDTYEGDWEQGVQHGSGQTTYASGAAYVGDYANGKPDGEGTQMYKDGSKYTGGFKKGKRHGEGKGAFKGGASYDGEWNSGQQHGQGVYIFPNKEQYDGQWKKGKQHGHGIYTQRIWEDNMWITRDHEGEWEEDVFLKLSEVKKPKGPELRQIEDVKKVFATINEGEALKDWPSEKLKKSAGKSGWGDWTPEEGMVGVVKHSWGGKRHLLEIIAEDHSEKHVVVGEEGLGKAMSIEDMAKKSEASLPTLRKIIDVTHVLPEINELSDWPSEQIKKSAGKSGWGDWTPAQEVGEVIKSWDDKHLLVFYKKDRTRHYCVVAEKGLSKILTLEDLRAMNNNTITGTSAKSEKQENEDEMSDEL